MMKKGLLLCVVVFLMTEICHASEIIGRWSGAIAEQYEITVNIKEDAGKLTAVVVSQMGEVSLGECKVNGNELVFNELSFNGIAVSYIKGKIDGDKMVLTIGFQGQDIKGELTRVKPE